MMEMDGMSAPCVYCAPSIEVSGPQLVLQRGAVGVEKMSFAVGTLGALTAFGALVAKKPVVTKIAASIGVLGGLGALALAIVRANQVNEARAMISTQLDELLAKRLAFPKDDFLDWLHQSTNALDWLHQSANGNMIDVFLGGATMAASAIALLLVPARR